MVRRLICSDCMSSQPQFGPLWAFEMMNQQGTKERCHLELKLGGRALTA